MGTFENCQVGTADLPATCRAIYIGTHATFVWGTLRGYDLVPPPMKFEPTHHQ